MLKCKAVTEIPADAIWVQQKLNGIRVRLTSDEYGLVKVLTRTPTDITAQCRRNLWFLTLIKRIPPNTILEGELHGSSTEDHSNVKNKLATGEPLELTIFAIIRWGSEWGTNDATDWLLEHVARTIEDKLGLGFANYRRLTESDTATSLLAEARDCKLEGWILKAANYSGWYKLKVESTIDCVVTGFTEGKGQHLGFVGALVVSVSGIEIAKVGGMTHEIRYAIDEDTELGRVCEVRYQRIGSRGRLQHPRFLRWRDDKKPNECILEQDEVLYDYWTKQV